MLHSVLNVSGHDTCFKIWTPFVKLVPLDKVSVEFWKISGIYEELIFFLSHGENTGRMLKNCFHLLSSYLWVKLLFSSVAYSGDSVTQPVSDLCIA